VWRNLVAGKDVEGKKCGLRENFPIEAFFPGHRRGSRFPPAYYRRAMACLGLGKSDACRDDMRRAARLGSPAARKWPAGGAGGDQKIRGRIADR